MESEEVRFSSAYVVTSHRGPAQGSLSVLAEGVPHYRLWNG